MSYSISQSGSTGEFKSQISGKTYPFKVEMTRADKRRACAEMELDHREISRGLEEKLGRKPTLRELQQGIAPADSRPLRQRIQEDGVVTTSPPRDENENPYTTRLVELQHQSPLTPADRSKQKRRIEMTKQASKEWEVRKAAEREAADEQKRIASDVADAKATVALCRFGTGRTAEECRIAERLLADLESSHDVEAYRKGRDHFESEVKERREQAARKTRP